VIAELGPALDHLRQAELRALCRVERHEQGTDHIAHHDCDKRPHQPQAEHHAERAGNHGQNLDVFAEPDREQVPRLATPLAKRDVVVAALLDRPDGPDRLVRVSHFSHLGLLIRKWPIMR
jgi:hypothetical protein